MLAFKWCLFVAWLAMVTAVAQTTPLSQTESDQVCLSEILIRAPQSSVPAKVATGKYTAEEVRKAIRLGGAFADLARANSQGPSAGQGGTLGCFRRGQLAKPVEEQVFRMKVGEVSEVLPTKQGFVILQVTGPEPASSLESPRQTGLSAHASGVRGRVVDNFDAPIHNAYVFAHRQEGADVHVRTDASGKYAVALPLGIYDLFISADGFSPTSRKVEVTPDGMMSFDAVLEFNGLGMEQQRADR